MAQSEPSAPLSVAMLKGNGESDEKPVAAVFGKTYEARLILGAYGGRFDDKRQVWTFPTEDSATHAVEDATRYFVMRAAARGGSA